MPIQNPSSLAAGITRRRFILAASASVICAPVIVRAASLMPVRAVGPIGPQYYGWVERTFIHGLTPHLSELIRAGMSAYGMAAELNRRKVSAVNGVPWEADSVTSATNLMKILEPNWRNCQSSRPFFGAPPPSVPGVGLLRTYGGWNVGRKPNSAKSSVFSVWTGGLSLRQPVWYLREKIRRRRAIPAITA